VDNRTGAPRWLATAHARWGGTNCKHMTCDTLAHAGSAAPTSRAWRPRVNATAPARPNDGSRFRLANRRTQSPRPPPHEARPSAKPAGVTGDAAKSDCPPGCVEHAATERRTADAHGVYTRLDVGPHPARPKLPTTRPCPCPKLSALRRTEPTRPAFAAWR
jgi:hypothetical protein